MPRRPGPLTAGHAVAVVRVEVRDGIPGELLIELIEVGRGTRPVPGAGGDYG